MEHKCGDDSCDVVLLSNLTCGWIPELFPKGNEANRVNGNGGMEGAGWRAGVTRNRRRIKEELSRCVERKMEKRSHANKADRFSVVRWLMMRVI